MEIRKHLAQCIGPTVLLALAVPASLAGPANEVTRSELTTTRGTNFSIYTAGPEAARAGVLVVHDWFGVTEFTRKAVARLGQLGYRAVAVDLYDDQSATKHPDAYKLMQSVDKADARDKLRTALQYLKENQERIATFGFSMGSTFALQINLNDPKAVAATVIWYGATVNDRVQLGELESPVLVVYGSRDGNAAEQAAAFSKLTDELNKSAEIYIYPGAKHAFAQPLFNGGRSYDPDATRAAWNLTEDFLNRTLSRN